ncbi:DUF4358 domain-containing protein [Pseudoflavonifractor capillosus]|uniref:DUF4358 domain-containing protein n=1 Tax=Pseudoflavonifractor capillosus TaxID=106588 RepID=A0A921MM03_9FIRM|nr:DUF4358 domain-containing protein [Pseudoflavonifractor capillosus]HJG87063.1 DUF4358 domain-containing protein [Pseudoflavonifractor capillosus]
MMKHSLTKLLCLAAALCLLLGACSAPADSGSAAFDPEAATQAVLDSGAFSVELTELDAALLYDFSGYGLDSSTLTASKAYSASGFAEQVSVTVWKDEAAAQAAVDMFKTYLEDMAATYKDYAPAEVPKLENAVLELRGSSVLLAVANDAGAAKTAVDGLK